MGWCSATEYVDSTYNLVEKYLPEDVKPKIAADICRIFQSGDWDCEQDSETYYVALKDDEYFVDEHCWHYVKTEEDFKKQLDDFNEYASEPLSEERMIRLIQIFNSRK